MSIIYLSQEKVNCVYHIYVSGKGKFVSIIYLSQEQVNCVNHILVSGKGKLCLSYTCLRKR